MTQEDLARARSQIGELEETEQDLRKENARWRTNVEQLAAENEKNIEEISTLRTRADLSHRNWLKERDDLVRHEANTREEYEVEKQARHDWEVLAMEERALRETLSEKVAELEERLASQVELYERAATECDSQSQTVDGLQKALQEIQQGTYEETPPVPGAIPS